MKRWEKMMFKKKWPFRRRSVTRKLPARLIPKSIARVRTDWVSVYNPTDTFDSTGCQYIVAPWSPITIPGLGVQCFSSFSLNVMFAQTLTDLYGDDVKIVKMVGDFWFRPVFVPADACFTQEVQDLINAWENYFIQLKGGLFKQRIVTSDSNVEGVVPHPMTGQDWSDAGFLKTFTRTWVPEERLGNLTYGEGAFLGVYGNTVRALYNTPPTASGTQATFNVPAISTSAVEQIVGGESCRFGPSYHEVKAPSWKRVNFSSRRTIRMHEHDNLAWFFDWAQLSPSQEICEIPTPVPPPCAMHIVPSLKIKLQYG